MNITAAMVKELRERTGSGMMECKKALVEAKGDLEAAVELMRKSGLAKADKKATRTAAEGRICIDRSSDGRRAAILEVNCETDFVAKADQFIDFSGQVTRRALESSALSLDELLRMPFTADGVVSIDEARKELIAKLGENINVRRFERYATERGILASYLHGSRIGVLVELTSASAELAKDIALHVAASRPMCVDAASVPAPTIAKEKAIFQAQAMATGKPANIVEKMVEGRLKKFLGEITLLGQPFVKDPDITVGELLKKQGATVLRFVRFEVGEGIEKDAGNFAEEVMAQVRGS